MKGKTKKSGFWRTTAFSRGFQKYMGCPVSSCILGVLGFPKANIIYGGILLFLFSFLLDFPQGKSWFT